MKIHCRLLSEWNVENCRIWEFFNLWKIQSQGFHTFPGFMASILESEVRSLSKWTPFLYTGFRYFLFRMALALVVQSSTKYSSRFPPCSITFPDRVHLPRLNFPESCRMSTWVPGRRSESCFACLFHNFSSHSLFFSLWTVRGFLSICSNLFEKTGSFPLGRNPNNSM